MPDDIWWSRSGSPCRPTHRSPRRGRSPPDPRRPERLRRLAAPRPRRRSVQGKQPRTGCRPAGVASSSCNHSRSNPSNSASSSPARGIDRHPRPARSGRGAGCSPTWRLASRPWAARGKSPRPAPPPASPKRARASKTPAANLTRIPCDPQARIVCASRQALRPRAAQARGRVFARGPAGRIDDLGVAPRFSGESGQPW